ncbi:MAG: multidrug effflux MFS transporter [Rhodobacteraceae bacterium]|nr:multidrug effflux MFS transporter [Paracoccaceae bacterium]
MLAPARTPPTLATLIILTGLSVLTLNMFLPSLTQIAETYGADYRLVNLSIAGYLAVTGVLQIIIGPLSDRFGRRPVLLSGMGVFCVASLGCVLAQDIQTFLAFRMCQAAVITGAVLSRAVVRDRSTTDESASILGYIGMVMAIAPMTAPMIGGVLDQLFGWRASFVFMLIAGVVVSGLIWVDLGETNKSPSATFRAQFAAYPELLTSRRFWGYSACLTCSIGAFFGFLGGAPLAASVLFDLSPTALGVGMGSITGGFMVGNFLSGHFSQRLGLTTMMILGRSTACVGLLIGLTLFASGVSHVLVLFGPAVMTGLGNGLTVPAANAGVLSVRPNLAGSASGLSGALTVAGGAVITWGTAVILNPDYVGFVVHGVMMACAAAGLAAALYVRHIDVTEGPLGA